MITVIARILLRYVSGGLMVAGLDPEIGATLAADPDVLLLVGAGLGALVEAGYALAKRKGWAT